MLRPGEVFAGYTIERLLGRGGMGSVYLARHPRLPRSTAMKLLHPEVFHDKEIRTRFEREADLVARLDHPNIVTVFDRGVEDEQLWISMRYIDGTDAAAVDAATMAPQRAVWIVAETAKALDFAHSRGVLHRDVKPANILLEHTGDAQDRVFLTDFGIARLRDDTGRLTQTGTFTATLAYAAPEQLAGAPLDHRADQYSLACTLFRLLTGTVPFDATNPVAVIQGHLHAPPPPVSRFRPDLPQALDAVLARALAKRAADRFGSCAEFAAAARRALTPPVPNLPPPQAFSPPPQPPVPAPPRQPLGEHGAVPAAPRRSRALGAGIGALLALGLLATITVVALRDDGSATTATPTSTHPVEPTAPTKPPAVPPPGTTTAPSTPDRAQIGAYAATLSDAFPGMLPKTSADQLVHAGSGYNKAGCFASDPSAEPADDEDPSLGAWLVQWRCFGGPNKAIFSFFLYASPADVRAALDGLPEHERATAVNHGREYTNYTLRHSGGQRQRMVTEFGADPRWDSMLMYCTGFIATDAEFMDWWTRAPLS
ncbi:protein kinase [Nocardia brasiliensis]|uniref:non-specific serine/threonine protein kinase n=1 Tax=Nocardia brasiliensis TaxID=37326 RepID=A0A6G9XY84_NOCBR|nr:serine/threonine-protein kinase [Nocardia brasiliensis]QIS05874.1 protein kinase [Nocardia brasiliensis]